MEQFNNSPYKDDQDSENQSPADDNKTERPPNPYFSSPVTSSTPFYQDYSIPGNQTPADPPSNPYLNPYQGNSNWPPPGAPNPYQNPNSYQAPNPYQNPYTDGAPAGGYYQQPPVQPAPTAQRRVIRGAGITGMPRWTSILLGVILVVFVGQLFTGGSIDGQTLDKLMQAGAIVKDKIQAGEWWRLITPIFLHFGFIHILFNSIALYAFGSQLERLIGSPRFLVIFFLSGIGGNVLALAMQNGNAITAGASTAIFGLLGALIGFFYRNRATMGAWGRANLQSLLITAGINFVFTLSIPGISLGGHLGGVLVGLFLGYFLSPLQVRQTIGANAQAGMVRARDFALEWWPIVATLAVEALVLYIALQSPATTVPRFR